MGLFTSLSAALTAAADRLIGGKPSAVVISGVDSSDIVRPVLTGTDGKVVVDLTIDETLLAKEAKQDTQIALDGPKTAVCSTQLEHSHVIGAAPCTLYHLSGRIDSTHATATYYVQCLNAAALPDDGAVTHLLAPIKVQHVIGTDSEWDFEVPDRGVAASAGVVCCLSSTEFTKTIGGAFLSIDGVRS